jgi:hypothetical protein
MTDVKKVVTPIEQAITDAIVKVIAAVGTSAGAGAGTAQATTGAQGTGGGTAVEAGQSSQATQTTAGHKNDVSVPEAMESLNIHAVKDAVLVNKALVAQAQSNSKLYDVTATALGLATLTATHHMGLVQQASQDHRDLAHDRQWNINETDLYSTVAGTVTAAVLAAMGKNSETND